MALNLDNIFIPIRNAIYKLTAKTFEMVASLFGYPESLGMPTIYQMDDESYVRSEFFWSLPEHKTYWPPYQRPQTLFEMIFGSTPTTDTIPRYIYESKEEGFYNFYIENYKNMFFLPDWLSEFIQIRLDICLDISSLEALREALFIVVVIYAQLFTIRIILSWMMTINPFTFPWIYLSAAVDWSEELFQGAVPTILGINVTSSMFLMLLGRVADDLNNLVFTMPFLPSEAEETKLLINQEMKNVLVFHYLPILWYKHPIPNNIKEYWYNERPEILEYMQTAYKDLDLQLLPDLVFEANILQEILDGKMPSMEGMADQITACLPK